MLASIFVAGGVESLRNPRGPAKAAEPVVDLISRSVPQVPHDPELFVRVNGAVHVLSGTLFALGRFPRLNALVLAGTLVPTTWGGHRYWEESDAGRRADQQMHFMKNVGLLGGLLLAVAGGRKRAKASR